MGLKQAPKKSWYELAAEEQAATVPGEPSTTETVAKAEPEPADSGRGGGAEEQAAPQPPSPPREPDGSSAQQEATVVPIGARSTPADERLLLPASAPESTKALQKQPFAGDSPSTEVPAGVRRVVSSKRGKRDYNYSWPKDDLAVMRKVFQHYVPLYRRYWAGRDPGGNYRLTFSPFVARALQEAFKDPTGWLSTVRNDARKEPIVCGREQVGLVWPASVEEQVVDLWETLDRDLFPEGFLLTKQHLAAAAILEGLKTVEEWFSTVANDDRFSVPVASDGRLRENKRSEDAPSSDGLSLDS
jgi:hypothetical protein